MQLAPREFFMHRLPSGPTSICVNETWCNSHCHFPVIYLPTIFSLSASDSLYTLAITFMNMRNTDRLPEFRKTLRHIPKEVLRCRNLSTAAQMPPSSPKILPRAPLAPP